MSCSEKLAASSHSEIYILQQKLGSHMQLGSHSQLLTHLYSRFPVYVPSHISSCSHFGSPVRCRHFEDVATVAGNRCIKHGSYSTHAHRQMEVGIFSKDLDILKTYIALFDVAGNKRHALCRPRSGMESINLVEIQCAVPE